MTIDNNSLKNEVSPGCVESSLYPTGYAKFHYSYSSWDIAWSIHVLGGLGRDDPGGLVPCLWSSFTPKSKGFRREES